MPLPTQSIDRSLHQVPVARVVTYGRDAETIQSNVDVVNVSRNRRDPPLGSIDQTTIFHTDSSPGVTMISALCNPFLTSDNILKPIVHFTSQHAEAIKEDPISYLSDECIIKAQVDNAVLNCTDDQKTAIYNNLTSLSAKRAYDILEVCIIEHDEDEESEHPWFNFGCEAVKDMLEYMHEVAGFGMSTRPPLNQQVTLILTADSMTHAEEIAYLAVVSDINTKFD